MQKSFLNRQASSTGKSYTVLAKKHYFIRLERPSSFTHIIFRELYKLVQSFWVHCSFTGQFNTEDYGAFTDVI